MSLRLQCAIQQARDVHHPLCIIYMDLATFFPRIDREIGTIGELLLGLPEDAAWAALLIYGGSHLRLRARASQLSY